MRKTIKTSGIIGTMTISLCGAYLFGTTQADTAVQAIDIEKVTESVPSGYMDTDTDEFYHNFIDMRTVTDFIGTDDGLHLYFMMVMVTIGKDNGALSMDNNKGFVVSHLYPLLIPILIITIVFLLRLKAHSQLVKALV